MKALENLLAKKFIDDFNKPYKIIKIGHYENVYLEGYQFPLNLYKEVFPQKFKFTPIKTVHPLKTPMDKHQLVSRLRTHGIIIEKDENELAEEFVFMSNYYKVSVFSRYLRNESLLIELINLYEFDRFLADTLFALITPIEIYLKATLANFLSVNYSNIVEEMKVEPALVYLDYNIYKEKDIQSKDVDRMLSNFSRSLVDKVGKDLTVDHHVTKYGGQIPIWVLVEHLTLGEFSMFLTKLNRQIVKQWTEECVEGSWQKAIAEWINTVRLLRNSAAHNNRIYGSYFTYSPSLPNDFNFEEQTFNPMLSESDKKSLKSTLFSGLLIIKQFYCSLSYNDQKRWNAFLEKLDYKIKSNSNIELRRMTLPENWKILLEI